MKCLLETTEVYRVDTDGEAKQLIEDAKQNSLLAKYNCIHKEKKIKGEVAEEWYRVTLTKKWSDEKDPCGDVRIEYKEGAF